MGRKAISDMKMTFRIDSALHRWFKTYCEGRDTNMSVVFREMLQQLKQAEQHPNSPRTQPAETES
jgi:hypothetical protein